MAAPIVLPTRTSPVAARLALPPVRETPADLGAFTLCRLSSTTSVEFARSSRDRIVLAAAMLLLTIAAVAVVVPRALAYPVAAVATWLAGALVYHRCRSAAAQRRRRAPGRDDFGNIAR